MIIDSLEKLRFQLSVDRQLLPELKLYVFLDSDLHPEILRTYFLLDDTPNYFPLFLGTHLEDLSQSSPYLIEASDNTLEFVEWLFTNGKQWGFFYFSTHTLDEALNHWQDVLLSNIKKSPVTNNPNNHYLLRFYDAQVLITLINNPNYHEFHTVLKPCSTLYLQDNCNQWIQYTPSQAQHNKSNLQQDSFIQAIENNQLPPLFASGIAKRFELIFWEKSPHLVEKFSPLFREKAIQQGVSIALEANIIQQENILAFLDLWLDRGPGAITSEENLRYIMDASTPCDKKIHYLRNNTPPEDSWNQAPLPL